MPASVLLRTDARHFSHRNMRHGQGVSSLSLAHCHFSRNCAFDCSLFLNLKPLMAYASIFPFPTVFKYSVGFFCRAKAGGDDRITGSSSGLRGQQCLRSAEVVRYSDIDEESHANQPINSRLEQCGENVPLQ